MINILHRLDESTLRRLAGLCRISHHVVDSWLQPSNVKHSAAPHFRLMIVLHSRLPIFRFVYITSHALLPRIPHNPLFLDSLSIWSLSSFPALRHWRSWSVQSLSLWYVSSVVPPSRGCAERSCSFVPRRDRRGLASPGSHLSLPDVLRGQIPKGRPSDLYATLTLSTLSRLYLTATPFVGFQKLGNRNSWLKSITSSFMSSGGTIRSESTPMPPLDTPTHVRRRARSLVDPKAFISQGVEAEDPRLPDHMRRPELQLRRIQRRDLPPSRPDSNRSSSVERAQKHALWWAS